MGNCMETCTLMEQGEEEVKQQKQGEGGKRSGGGRVKVVLTKEELKWLILELNGEKGGRRGGLKLEQVLQQIERARQQQQGPWKPSLESILEAPEMLEFDTEIHT
ncbi:hypothetical protein HN51_068944 [Arachis hypogaea]|uniref:Uncharacterized protein n=1 Tax=Arachis hypogaea TaxID=3818 RepID=A0A444Z8A5_ARAHY|nr:uncharacterized protein DS421_15g495320 [Arachis hypogaea]RYR10407.1 hypothetical protein Ahy_B05g078861 [Arachis hypogaea]